MIARMVFATFSDLSEKIASGQHKHLQPLHVEPTGLVSRRSGQANAEV
jgi:hypothetical protein